MLRNHLNITLNSFPNLPVVVRINGQIVAVEGSKDLVTDTVAAIELILDPDDVHKALTAESRDA